MTGQLVFEDKEELIAGGHPFAEGNVLEEIGGKLPNKYTRFILNFSGDKKIILQ